METFRFKKYLNWIRERIPVNLQNLKTLTNEPVPSHLKHWWYALGGTPAILFSIQIVTGIFLLIYYVPTPTEAYASIQGITYEIQFGWYIRSLHKWASELMVLTVILHMSRVFFTGAYRKPREINWMIGVVILFLTLGLGFTGYSLIYDQLSYWATVVGTKILENAPVVGPMAADFIRGGPEISGNTLTRLYVFHVVVFPLLLAGLVVVHIIFVRLHGVTEFEVDEDKRLKHKTFPLFPNHVLTEGIIAILILYLLTIMAIVFPAGLGDRANPLVTPEHIKPEWYFYASFRWLKLTNIYVGVLGQIAFIGIIIFWPFIDRIFEKKLPNAEISVWIGVFGFSFYLALMVWEAMV